MHEYLTFREVLELLNISEEELYRLLLEKELETVSYDRFSYIAFSDIVRYQAKSDY